MEFEEIQAIWSDLSNELDKQKRLTHQIIMEMTQEKYRNKFRKLATYETGGALMCYAAAVVLLLNFRVLDTWYLALIGVLALAYMIGLPILVLGSLYKIRSINIIDKSYKETLLKFTRARKRLLKIQQWGIYGGMIFLLLSVPLSVKLIDHKDFFKEELNGLLVLTLLLSLAFVYFFSRLSYRHYVGAANRAEELLRELE